MDKLYPPTIAPGTKLTWRHYPRGGWGYVFRIPVTVVRCTAKRVLIEVPLERGGIKQVWVKRESLGE